MILAGADEPQVFLGFRWWASQDGSLRLCVAPGMCLLRARDYRAECTVPREVFAPRFQAALLKEPSPNEGNAVARKALTFGPWCGKT